MITRSTGQPDGCLPAGDIVVDERIVRVDVFRSAPGEHGRTLLIGGGHAFRMRCHGNAFASDGRMAAARGMIVVGVVEMMTLGRQVGWAQTAGFAVTTVVALSLATGDNNPPGVFWAFEGIGVGLGLIALLPLLFRRWRVLVCVALMCLLPVVVLAAAFVTPLIPLVIAPSATLALILADTQGLRPLEAD